MKHEDAITKLEDYGYSYYFSQTILQLARKKGNWESLVGDITVTWDVEDNSYTVIRDGE